ncbi:MAG: hypothetical protein DA446_08375, partial [Bacteroidetes bacterium]
MIETKSMFTILLFLGSILGQTGHDAHSSGVAHSPEVTIAGDGSPINPNKKEMDGTAGTAESAESAEGVESAEGTGTAKSAGIIVFAHGAWGGGWDYKSMEAILE